MLALAAPAAARGACAEMPAEPEPVFVTFFGVSTILVRAGNQAVMVDGFFSRPSPGRTLFFDLSNNDGRIRHALDGAGLNRGDRTGGTRLRALLVAQGHHDHSMDAGQVAYETGATLVGSSSTINSTTGPYPSLVSDPIEGPFEKCFGPFDVRAIPSPHSGGFIPFLVRGRVRETRLSPAHALAYRNSINFSFLIRYGKRTILVHPSANYPTGDEPGLGDIRADLTFLSIGDLGRLTQSDAGIRAYWDAVARESEARIVVPIHWDDFLRPVPLPGTRPRRVLHGLPAPLFPWQFSRAMRVLEQRARQDCVGIRFLPPFEQVALDRLLAESDAGACRRTAESN